MDCFFRYKRLEKNIYEGYTKEYYSWGALTTTKYHLVPIDLPNLVHFKKKP